MFPVELCAVPVEDDSLTFTEVELPKLERDAWAVQLFCYERHHFLADDSVTDDKDWAAIFVYIIQEFGGGVLAVISESSIGLVMCESIRSMRRHTPKHHPDLGFGGLGVEPLDH